MLGSWSRRSALAGLVALVPLTGAAKKKRRRKPRRRRHAPRDCGWGNCDVGTCAANPCGQEAAACGPPGGDCRCPGPARGAAACVHVPPGEAPPCDDGCALPAVCLETCAHPGERRCYVLCSWTIAAP